MSLISPLRRSWKAGFFSLQVGFLAVFLSIAPWAQAGDDNTVGASSIERKITPADPGAIKLRTQQLARLGVEEWHQAGLRGKGVKIAILDSGFRGYRNYLGRYLPANIQVRSFRKDGNLEARDSQHGILCGEVVHTLAPDAELLFANWEPHDPKSFLKAVAWARESGARIISCSVIMPNWSDGEGGGEVHARLAQLLGRGDKSTDMLCFASAGNIAQRHWSGTFRNNGESWHLWQDGTRDNTVTPWGDDTAIVELYSPPGAVYELVVIDRQTGKEVGRSMTHAAADRCTAAVHIHAEGSHAYLARVRLVRGPAGTFHLASLSSDLEFAKRDGSIAFPADGPEVVAVAAVDESGQRMSYSACGPNSKQPKPDLSATVPFTSLWRSRPFAGTSAAAPQAAALAALWLSRDPTWSAGMVRKALNQNALDLGPRGHDWETGYGLLRLPAPKELLAGKPATSNGPK